MQKNNTTSVHPVPQPSTAVTVLGILLAARSTDANTARDVLVDCLGLRSWREVECTAACLGDEYIVTAASVTFDARVAAAMRGAA